MWPQMTSPLMAGVPINRKRVQTIMRKRLASPASARADQNPVTVGSFHAEGAVLNPGMMRIVSPDEAVHAVVLRVAERLEDSCSEAEASSWCAVLTSWPMQFEQHDSVDDLFW